MILLEILGESLGTLGLSNGIVEVLLPEETLQVAPNSAFPQLGERLGLAAVREQRHAVLAVAG